MHPSEVAERVAELSDLELALLLSFVAKEHCLIQTEAKALDSLQQELQLVRRDNGPFSLLAEFLHRLQQMSMAALTLSLSATAGQVPMSFPPVYILDQMWPQAFEKAAKGSTVPGHVKDHICFFHCHHLDDGFVNLETASEWIEDDQSSSSSVIRKSVVQSPEGGTRRAFQETDIRYLIEKSRRVKVTAEIKCYLQNIVTFLRVHRAVDGGITPRATKSFDTMIKCLAPLHGLEYVTPALVAIAARKIYPHRIAPTTPERDWSLQYGSDLAAVRVHLQEVTPESIIEDVLAAVEAPL
ncbi:MAG: hypothetical protein Q9218_000872 [Villophora microphyllina]